MTTAEQTPSPAADEASLVALQNRRAELVAQLDTLRADRERLEAGPFGRAGRAAIATTISKIDHLTSSVTAAIRELDAAIDTTRQRVEAARRLEAQRLVARQRELLHEVERLNEQIQSLATSTETTDLLAWVCPTWRAAANRFIATQ